MLGQCVTLAVLGCVLAVPAPRAQHQYQQQQQSEGVPPHLLRQYLADQGGPAAAQTQVIPRPAHIPGAAPAPARHPYAGQNEGQYQQQPQYQQQQQPQYRPQPQQYQPQPQQYQQQQQQQQQQQYQQQQEPPRQPQEDYEHNPSYQFGFDVNDDQFTNYQNRKEQRDGDVIKGSYSVVDSDGFLRTVTYTADPKEGFKAEVQRQPTDIVVKVPTPKPQAPQPQPQQQLAHVQPNVGHAQPRPQQPPPQYYRYE